MNTYVNLDINELIDAFLGEELWNTTVSDTTSVFHGYSSIIEFVCKLINDNMGNFTEVVFIHLTSPQRNQIYRQLSEIGIRFIKNVPTKSISVLTYNIWTIPQLAHSIYPFQHTPLILRNFENFYNTLSIDANIVPFNNSPQWHRIIVSMEQFFELKKINRDARSFQTSQLNIVFDCENTYISLPDNMQKKLDISDLLFDIKEKITSGEYKELMEKLADIK
jgi:hypothetical protein